MRTRTRYVRRAGAVLLLTALVTCTPQAPGDVYPLPDSGRPDTPAPVPAPGPVPTPPANPELPPTPVLPSPDIRIGLVVGAPQAEITGDSGLTITDRQDVPLGETGAGARWTIRLEGPSLSAGAVGGGRVAGQQTIRFNPAGAGGLVGVNGRWYHGTITVFRDRTGMTVINAVPIEDYLAGVVAAEMGRRELSEGEALTAQAIVSRTFAIRNLGKRLTQGFDLYATVADQVYGGVTSEYPLAREAVRRTGGLVLTWEGVPIDAFFFSTCGGRTADGTEVFAGANRPYLKAIHDVDPSGQAWCRNSPRFRWREEWSGEQLRVAMRRTLPPAVPSVSAEAAATVSGVSITGRSSSDRVIRLAIRLQQRSVDVSGPAVRQVLRPLDGGLLRSASFQLTEIRDGSKLTRLVAEGGGSGHGVGYCQWGAIGRSRAGQDARTILSAYFPGTSLSRAY